MPTNAVFGGISIESYTSHIAGNFDYKKVVYEKSDAFARKRIKRAPRRRFKRVFGDVSQ